ncbi:unnamed protein product [Owenia fusiformis]|uniref:Solute-binding protein family 3/N-terminal domain-containing protein n=1 Tax=Owenia fusiformis TaxID=6347 RepID=A0A8J1TUU4_OWEFU|nr:unnamed protein product [Owenia fusiformis]
MYGMGTSVGLILVSVVLIGGIVSGQPFSEDAEEVANLHNFQANLVGPEKIWVFAVAADTAPMSYINNTQQSTGFAVDLVYEVCRLVNRKCKVMVTEFEECWEKREYYLPGLPTIRVEKPGLGLMNRWFDACVAWDETPARALKVDFSIPFAATAPAKFWVPKAAVSDFNWLDVSWKRIAFIGGMVASPECATLNGVQGVPSDPPLMFAVPDVKSGIAAVRTGRVKAFFTNFDIPEESNLIPIGSFYCSDATSVMTRKDSRLLDWWDDAFDNFKIGGGYQQFCELAPFKYVQGYNVACL